MVISLLASFIISAIFFVVGELLRPKPDFEDAEAVPFEDARLPQTNPERKQGVGWGQYEVTSPHLMDVLEYNVTPIRKKIKTSMFSSTRVVVGNRYLFGVQLGLHKGPLVLKAIYYDDEEVWSGTSDTTANSPGETHAVAFSIQGGGNGSHLSSVDFCRTPESPILIYKCLSNDRDWVDVSAHFVGSVTD